MSDSDTPLESTQAAFDRTVAGLRRRWRLRRVLEGAALALAAVLAIGLAAAAVMDAAFFAPEVVSAARAGFYLLAALALGLLVGIPALRRASDEAMARYVESKAPELDALLLSAVDARAPAAAGAAPEISSALSRRLVDRATEVCRAMPAVSGLERARMRRALGAVAAVVLLGAGFATLGPEGWRHGAWLLLASQEPAASAGPYAIRVAPGNVSILAGEDLHIAATPEGFRPDRLVLVTRSAGAGQWTREPLPRSPETDAFEAFLFDVSASLDYRIEHPALSSPAFRVDVIPRPVAERIDLRYEFPPYTGRAPELVTDGGDIAAVRGTRVEVRVTPSAPTGSGRLVIDDSRSVALRAGGDGDLRAGIEVTDNGRYRVELEAAGYGMAPASPEYAIVAREDTLPTVELVRPGSDARVTSIEQVLVEARAEDDVAVRELELVMSVNGGPDEVVPLGEGPGPRPSRAGAHELFLEERGLAPGDLIAYYVRASDAANDPGRRTSSDIFFMDVRPFEMTYRRGSGGGGGGGAGGQGGETLSAQQRTLVVALFKLVRDRPGMDETLAAERVETLGTAQTRIRDRVDAIVRRLGTRRIVDLDPGYRRMTAELPRASKAMLEVEAFLAAGDIDKALPPARQALLHLQRADSAFREAQVAQSQQRGGAGDAARSDLANLFRLEMDRFRNPYEDVQRGDWTPPDQRIDDALRKLRELAERQLRELERAGFRGQAADAGQQRALAEELAELTRELARLTRQQSSESVRGSLDELEAAARAMRRSAGGTAGAGAEALDRMRAAQRRLEGQGVDRLARETEEALRRAGDMAEAQAGIERDAAAPAGGDSRRDPTGLDQRKQALADEVKSMTSRLEQLAGDAGRNGQPAAGSALDRAAGALRDHRVAERIRRFPAPGGERSEEEAAITRELRALRDRIAAAAARIGASGDPGLSGLHETLRGTLAELNRDRERLADRARRGPALGGGGADRADLTEARRALAQQLGGIGGLAEALARHPGFQGSLEALNAAVEAAGAEDDADAAALARRQAALLAALQDIERRLRARLDQEPPVAWGAARSEPPPDQRRSIESYYRNLSEKASP